MDELAVVVGGLIAAAVGAVFTIGGTYWVSVRLDQQKELRQLRSAIRIVATELRENGERLASAGADVERKRERLLIGDWLGSKTAFAGLSTRNESLWSDVARAYGQISAFTSGWPGAEPPTVGQLSDLVSRLGDEEDRVDAAIGGFSRRLPRASNRI